MNQEPSTKLFAELYEELRRIASRELRRGGQALTLTPTTLLHEAYVAFAQRDDLQFADRGKFVAYASRVMRGLMIDFARNRQTLKRGAAIEIVAMPTQLPEQVADCREIERIGSAMRELESVEEELAVIVDLKFFCGFSFAEIAAMRGVSERTVQRGWDKARVFLYRELTTDS